MARYYLMNGPEEAKAQAESIGLRWGVREADMPDDPEVWDHLQVWLDAYAQDLEVERKIEIGELSYAHAPPAKASHDDAIDEEAGEEIALPSPVFLTLDRRTGDMWLRTILRDLAYLTLPHYEDLRLVFMREVPDQVIDLTDMLSYSDGARAKRVAVCLDIDLLGAEMPYLYSHDEDILIGPMETYQILEEIAARFDTMNASEIAEMCREIEDPEVQLAFRFKNPITISDVRQLFRFASTLLGKVGFRWSKPIEGEG